MSDTEENLAPTPETASPESQPTAAKAPKAKKSGSVTFRSTQPEVTEYEVMGIRGQRGPDNSLSWDVPEDLVQRFKRHIFVAQGRIAEAK